MEQEVETAARPATGSLPVWDATHRRLRIQVFGAGGAAGRELVAALLAAGHPPGGLSLYGRRGRSLPWRNGVLRISPVPSELAFAELAFLCTPPAVAARLAPILVARGTRVIDFSGTGGGRRDVPIVAPGIRSGELGAFTVHVGLPTRSAAVAIRPLWALERAVGLEEIVGTVLYSCAAEGALGILERREELAALERGEEEPHPHLGRIGNVLSLVGGPRADGRSGAEAELARDLGALLRRADLSIALTGLLGDVERVDVFAFSLRTRHPLEAVQAAEILAAAPGVVVQEELGGPSAREAAGSDLVHVGRIRAGSRGAASLCFVAVGDELRLGVANAGLWTASLLPLG
ncbi:MAG: Asd/ArgC dimerization domain-containing protein [Planctomycetota bacterium]